MAITHQDEAGGSTFIAASRRLMQVIHRRGLGYIAKACIRVPLGWVGRRFSKASAPPAATDAAAPDFDAMYHVQTWANPRGTDGLAEVTSPNWKHGVNYLPIDQKTFRGLLALLEIRHEDFTFIDLGCGKGRAILMASDYPFGRILGVEYSPALAAIAQKNLETYSNPAMKCRNIEVACADATAFEIPPGSLVFYLYNPFDHRVLEPIVKNMVRSLERAPRPLIVIYCNIEEASADVFRRHGFTLKADPWPDHKARSVIFQAPRPK